LIGYDPDPAVLIEAMDILHRAGTRAIASLRAFDDVVAGWVAWDDEAKIELRIIGSDEIATTIRPELAHPLMRCKFDHVATIELDRPRSELPQNISLSRGGEVFYSMRTIGNEPLPPGSAAEQKTSDVDAHRLSPIGADDITVIVPIYRDFEATRSCL